MASIINKATNIISKKSMLIAKRFFGFSQEKRPFAIEKTASNFNDPVNFISYLGRKGTYALFVLLVLLASQGKAQNINIPNKMGPLGTEVNTFTGNLFMQRNDINIPARRLDITVSFAYNTFNYNENKGYGNGWSFTYGLAYRLDSAGVVTIIRGDNREDTYTPTSGGTFMPPPGIFDNLTQYQPGKYLLKSTGGTQLFFDNATHRRITKVQEPNGNYLNFTYQDSLITAITNTAGQTISLSYSGGLLTQVVDAITSPTHTYTYQYDGYKNLTQITDPLGQKMQYQYLVNGPMSGVTDMNGNAVDIIYYPDFTVSELIGCNSRKSFSYDTISNTTTVTDYLPNSTNQITTYNYKTFGTIAWLSHLNGNCCGYNLAFDYDNNGNLIKKTDGNGNVYTYTYDNMGNLLTLTDPLGHKSSYTYSSDYNQVKSYIDPNGNSYAIDYDNAGNPTQMTEPNNQPSSFTYSTLGDILSATDAKGNAYHFSYDANGYPTQISQPLNSTLGFSFDVRGNMLSNTDPNGNVSSLQYDLLNRPTSIKDPLNHNTLVGYDANGNVTSITDQNGHTSTFSYDASNRPVAAVNANGEKKQYAYDAMDNLVQFTDPLGKTTSFGYDNLNRITSVTDALGNGYNFGYDYNGNMVSATLPNGNTTNYVYDKLDRPISGSDMIGSLGSITYDNNGNMVSYTNGTGATVSTTYDALNRVIGIIDPLGNNRSFTYDKNSNPTSVIDRNGHTSSYTYDALNRTTSMTDYNGNITGAGYDAAGNMLTATDANNRTTTYSYDALLRPNSITYPDGSAILLGYDNIGNVLSKRLTDGTTINYQYDAVNKMTAKILPANNNLIYTYDAKGRIKNATNNAGTVSLTYDDIDRLASETFNAHTTAYTYNTAARTKNIVYPDGSNITWHFDTRNRLSSINKGLTSIANYQYNNANQIQQLNYGNSTVTNWQYDQANRLTNLTTQASGLPTLAFTYDKEANKTAVTRANFPQTSEQYSYDAAHRLTGFTQGTSLNTYTYDGLGNRTSANLNGTANTYAVNNLNQYSSLNNGSQTTNFTYDGNGNLTNDGNFGKRYDAEGRLLVDSTGSKKLQYQYDAFGRRVQKTINGKATNYYYSGISQLEQRDALVDTVLNETVYGGDLTPVMVGVNHNSYYYHQNDLNSVEAISNAGGTLVERYQYDAYGAPSIYDSLGNMITASAIGNRFAFTGQEYDAETKNYHFHFRNYNPATGSFNQRDPIGYGDGMGMYQYVHNNPANAMDILGLSPCPPKVNRIDNAEKFVSFANAYLTEAEMIYLKALESQLLKSIINDRTARDAFKSEMQFTEAIAAEKSLISNLSNLSALKDSKYISNATSTFKLLGNTVNAVDFTIKLAKTQQAISNGDLLGTVEAGGNLLQSGISFSGLGSAFNFVDFTGGQVMNLATGGRVQSSGVLDFFKTQYSTNIENRYSNWQHQNDMLNSFKGDHAKLMNYFAALDKLKRIQDEANNQKNNPCPPNGNPNGNQKKKPPTLIQTGINIISNVINSLDPNEIIGPTGVGTPQFVSINDRMPYTINFENSINASAPAKTVRVNYPVDPKQDLSNISLGSFGFNSLTFNVPANTPSFYQRLDARDSLGLYVDVTAGLDAANHQIFWVFQSIDPVTLLTPSDPLKGFLLLTDTGKPAAGHGFVNFFTNPISSAITGDTVHAAATIVFDGNDTVPTNVAKNTIDAVAPTSQMNTLPANSLSTKVPLSWTAADDANGSGTKSYSLYVSVNNNGFGLYATNISKKDTTFTGAGGNTYSFFVLGTDSVGNTEMLKPGAEATTYISSSLLPVTWLYFNAVNRDKDGLLSWATATETNSKSFDIERSVDGNNFTKIGNASAAGNSSVQTNYTYTDKNVVSLNIPVVYYRLKQIDKDGKTTYSNIVAVQLPIVNVGPIVQAYPNPFKQTLNILIANITTLDLSDNIAIYTLEGRMVYQKPIGQRLLNTTITLSDLPTLTPGMYLLKLGLNKQSYSFKLMKQ